MANQIINPKVGQTYLWSQNCKSLIHLTVLEISDDNIRMSWAVFLKLVGQNDPQSGAVCWSKKEWNAAEIIEYNAPTLDDSHSVCSHCSGLGWYFERDFDILSCPFCENGLIVKEVVKSEPLTKFTRRSDMHPQIEVSNET